MIVPLQDLIVEKPNVVVLEIRASLMRKIVIPDLGGYVVVFGDLFQILVGVVLRKKT